MNTALRLAFVLAAIALLVGLFLAMRPDAPPASTAGQSSQAEAPLALRFEVRDGRRHAGPAVVRAKRGQELEITVVSDGQDELHLHGYDHTLPLQADQPASLRFRADTAGRFELELHGRHDVLTVIEVMPQ